MGTAKSTAKLYRSAIARMRFPQPTIDYVARRTAEGKTKPEIMRCLKHYLAPEIWRYLHPNATHPRATAIGASTPSPKTVTGLFTTEVIRRKAPGAAPTTSKWRS